MDTRKFAMAAPRLRLGGACARLPLQSYHIVDDLDGSAKTPDRLGKRIALFDKCNGVFSQFNRMRFTYS